MLDLRGGGAMASEFDDWITHKQAAALLGISSRRLYEWRSLGLEHPPSYHINHQHRFRRSEVLAWLAAHRTHAVA
jgi:predicted DNA-binding transcriptional regulator AlpA